MGAIVQRTFNGVPDKALSMCSLSDGQIGVAEVLSRRFGWGANWKVVRMGILCSAAEFPSQSYNRHLGFYWGACSGSRTVFDGVADTTCAGISIGLTQFTRFGYSDSQVAFQQNISTGSFFYFDGYSYQGLVNGVASVGSIGFSNGFFTMANSSDIHKRRSIYMLELSASSPTSFYMTMYGMMSASMNGKYANKDYTEEDLKAILTSSVFPTASGVPMDVVSRNIQFNTSSYPLDSAFIGTDSCMPLEIYDWYVYKIL